MNKFIIDMEKNLKQLNCTVYMRFSDSLKLISQENIEYVIKLECEKNKKKYILENDNFLKRASVGKSGLKSKYFDERQIIDIMKYEILLNDLYLLVFRNGMENCRAKKGKSSIDRILEEERYLQFKDDMDIRKGMAYIWNQGYGFAEKYPVPELIEQQYNLLKQKTIENVTLEKIKVFMQENKDIHIYLDEKKISDVASEFRNVKEIEYSYGHIVAKAYTYKINMNLLPLEGEIMVFDTEGINEVTRCNVKNYKKVYEEKLMESLFKNIDLYRKDECYIGRRNYEHSEI